MLVVLLFSLYLFINIWSSFTRREGAGWEWAQRPRKTREKDVLSVSYYKAFIRKMKTNKTGAQWNNWHRDWTRLSMALYVVTWQYSEKKYKLVLSAVKSSCGYDSCTWNARRPKVTIPHLTQKDLFIGYGSRYSPVLTYYIYIRVPTSMCGGL